MALIYAFMVNYRYLQNRSPAWFAQELHHRPLKIYRLSRINHLRVAYLILYPENGGRVCGVEVDRWKPLLSHCVMEN